MTRLRAARFGGRAIAAAILALALWLSAAVFAPVSNEGSAAWLTAVPPWQALAAAFAASLLVVAWRPPQSLFALLPLAAILLPWVPGLDAGLIYAGPMIVLIWAAAIVLGWGPALWRPLARCGCATSPNRATAAAFLIAIASTSLAAWRVAPMIPGGDEPHYLIITQSLLKDGDLRIENNHAQRDYAAYASGQLEPQYLTRGKDGAIYPVHAPGLPALVAPAFALAGYQGAIVFLIIVMALASALVWRLAWIATGEIGSAWFGWAAVAASCTWTFQSFLVFPDAMGAAALACGVWLILRLDLRSEPAPLLIAAVGAALALLPWLHTRFALIAAGLGLMIVLRLYRGEGGARRIALFLAPPMLAAAAWFAMFQLIYGTPSPIAQWGDTSDSRMSFIYSGLSGLLFDQQFGFLPYAPALAAGLVGLAVGHAANWRAGTRMQLALLIVAAYVAASASYAMWWGGLSVPARLFTVLLPVLAPGAAAVWSRATSVPVRALLSAALGWTIFATATLAFAERGLFAWNDRHTKTGLWFEWAAPLFNWPAALPGFFRADSSLGREALPLPHFYAVAGIWVGAIAIAVIAAFVLSRLVARWAGSQARVASAAITIAALALAAPIATVLALRAQGADGSSPSRAQIAFLARMAEGDARLFDLQARRRIDAGALPSLMRIDIPAGREPRTRGIGSVPAGAFRLTASPGGEPGQIFVGRASQPIAVLADAPLDVTLPVAVNALVIRGAEGRAITLQPLSSARYARSQRKAHRALRYDNVTVFFIDDRVYAEPDAFWVGGARFANVILQADPGVRHASLEITNAPVANRVSIVGAAQPFDRQLLPRETVVVPVAFDERGSARLQIESASGFIPALTEPGNGDGRFLGVSVRVRR